MCGISGIINFQDKPNFEGLKASAAKLTHRGPDDSGIWTDDQVGLAHRRLSIIDLAGGSQPMMNKNQTLVTVFNGEIYNYKDLRLQLEQKGHRFLSDSDTEIILHGYEEWQELCFEKFSGMFAICLYDIAQSRAILARDLFGEKPLYFSSNNEEILFASELKSLPELTNTKLEFDMQAISLYLRFGYIPAPYTLYKNVRKLKPGQLLLIDQHTRSFKDYKQNVFGVFPENLAATEDELASELETALISAATRMLNADVPVGSFLSGGLDSSLIAALIAGQGKTLKTFSISFKNKTFDESSHAEKVAGLIGADHTTYPVDLDGLPDCLSIYDSFDEPFSDPSAIPTYFLSRETKTKVTVALSGDGADEFWGGYRRYLAQIWAPYYLTIPHFLRRLLIELPIGFFKDTDVYFADSKIKSVRLFLDRLHNCDPGYNLLYHNVFSYQNISELFPGLPLDLSGTRSIVENMLGGKQTCDQLMKLDQDLYLPDDILVKVDRMSMQHSLEVRAPFLDPGVVKVSMKTPLNLKIKGGVQKYLLKKIALKYLPENIVFRKKHGFSVPISEWFKKMDKQKILELMPGNCSRKAAGIVIDEHLSGSRDNSQQLLSLAILGRYLN